MVLTMTKSIISLSELKADASRLLDKIRDEPSTLVITQNGRARAVVEDYEHHQAQQQALVMLERVLPVRLHEFSPPPRYRVQAVGL
jgi:prevent-host-death family protein